MSKVGYARVSTTEQSLDLQILKLTEAGCSKIFSDTSTGSDIKRQGLVDLMEYLRTGDTLVITRIDRIARSVLDFQQMVKTFNEQKILLTALEQSISTDSASGKAFLDMLAVFAEFELNIRRERQLEGIAAAKAAGKYKGRKPLSNTIKQQVISMHSDHQKITQISSVLGISRNSVYKILNEEHSDP